MRNAFLAGASAIALVLGGCSMFDHGESEQPIAASPQSYQAPATSMSGSSAAPSTPSTGAGATGASTPSSGSTAAAGSPGATHRRRAAMSATEVKEAQQKLKDGGEYKGQIDGKFGPQTAGAVKQFQQKNGLHQTGRLDRETLNRLGVAGAGTTGSGSSRSPATGSSGGNDNGMGTGNGNNGAAPRGGSL